MLEICTGFCIQVFQKGSPIARDVSEAILTLMENGMVKNLTNKYLGSSDGCLNSETESLSLKSFWGLFLVSAAISTICFLIFTLRLLKKKPKDSQVHSYDLAQRGGSSS